MNNIEKVIVKNFELRMFWMYSPWRNLIFNVRIATKNYIEYS